jgi:DNA-binding response OmpR family regulator
VVDDERDFLELISHGLERDGFRCTVARDGLDGLTKARETLPDAIVLDVMLPDLDGFTVCEMLRKQPSTARIPVVMLTCLGGTMSRLNGLSSGADQFMSKPFKMHELITSIETAITRRREGWEALHSSQ